MKPARNQKIDPNRIKTRDLLMVRLIQGMTRANVQKDEKKAASKTKCRAPIQLNSEE